MPKKPRDYQTAAATALWHQIHGQPNENPLVVMPTGSGKSLTMAMFMKGMVEAYPGIRILNLTHVKELVRNNHDTLVEMWPTAPTGIYSAGLRRRDLFAQLTFAGIDSFRGVAPRFGKVDIVIVDEAHRIGDNDKSTYHKVFTELRKKNKHLLVIGFTATDYRVGMGKLTDGKFFDVVCFDLSSGPAFIWMLEQRYLLRLVPKRPRAQVDADGVTVRNGEYDDKAASQALHDQDIIDRAVDELIEHAEADNRQAWLIFAQSIEDAEEIAQRFRDRGYPVEAVHSKRNDRDAVLAAFEAGQLRGVVNQGVLTTGYDNPRIDLIGMLRLTRSPGLWVQMLGRGTRPCWAPGYDLDTWDGRNASILASGKQNCLVLDFAGNTTRLGPINYPTLPKRKGSKSGDPPVRECPECGTYNHISLKCCEGCGFEFPVAQKLQDRASHAELVVDLNSLPPPEPKEFAVYSISQMVASVHPGKHGKPPTMRVDYFSGIQRFSTWVCFAHPGFPRRRAEAWWAGHSSASGRRTQCPADAAEGVARFSECTKPHHIKVWINTKFPEVVAYDFLGTKFELPPELGGPPLTKVDAFAPNQDPATQKLLQEMFGIDDIPF